MEIEKFRFPGEFEPQTDVFINWLPDYCAGEDGDKGREVLVEVVKNLLGHVNVHVNCGCETSLEACKQMLADAGVDVSDPDTEGQRNTAADNGDEKFSPFIRFTQFDDWSVSIRDNGPDAMIDDEGNTLVVNPSWSFYGRYEKNEGLRDLSRQIGVHAAIGLGCYDVVSSDMVSEGGDREFNGAGVLMVIEDTEVRKRNPQYTKEQIEEEFKKLWNVEKIIWLPQPLYDDDDFRMAPLDYEADGTPIVGASFAAHSDEMCRFVAKDTILLAEVTEEEAAANRISAENKRRLDAAYEVVSQATDVDGNPFKILRIPASGHIQYVQRPGDDLYDYYHELVGDAFMDGTPWPEDELHLFGATSYCNFLVCNNLVLGQRYWHEGMDEDIKVKDAQAEEALKAAFPDRKVVMIDSLALNMAGGGVHCWTKNVYIPKRA